MKEKENEVFTVERREDLEGLNEKREEAQKCSYKYWQRMTETYSRTIKERMFTKGQLVLCTADRVKRGMAVPSKFSSKWE